jgi:hypothetical protein
VEVVARGHQIVAQGAGVEIAEAAAAHQFLVSVLDPNLIEQARGALRTEGLGVIGRREDRVAGRFR